MTSPTPETLAEVERMLPCHSTDAHVRIPGMTWAQHGISCPAQHRPAVAQALQSLKDRNAELEAKVILLIPYRDELLKIAEDVGEPDDPFAAWETIHALAQQEAEKS